SIPLEQIVGHHAGGGEQVALGEVGLLLLVAGEKEKQLCLQCVTRTILVKEGEKWVGGLLFQEARRKPCREPGGEGRLAGADGPFDRDVARCAHARGRLYRGLCGCPVSSCRSGRRWS